MGKAREVDTRLAQRYEVANDLLNLRGLRDRPYYVVADFRHKDKIYE